MLAPAARAPNSQPSPLPSGLLAAELGPVVMADDPCEAAFSVADPTGPRNYYRARYYDPKVGRFVSEDPIGFLGGDVNLYAYVRNRPSGWVDPSGLSSLVYYPATNQLYVQSGSGQTLNTYSAYNNAASNSGGAWAAGTYNFSWWNPHPGNGPSGPYGSYGNFIFDVPGRPGMGVHSGRQGVCDDANRCDAQHATMGCIRTTDAATKFIKDTHPGGDPLTSITVQDPGIQPLGPTRPITPILVLP